MKLPKLTDIQPTWGLWSIWNHQLSGRGAKSIRLQPMQYRCTSSELTGCSAEVTTIYYMQSEEGLFSKKRGSAPLY